jgi:hypothetical protein
MKKLNKKRLAKLAFWISHIIATGAIILGLVLSIARSTMEKNFLQLYDDCFKRDIHSIDNIDKYCSPFLKHIQNYDAVIFKSFVLAIIILLVYWIIRGLYKYLFIEEQEKTDRIK